MRRVVLVACLVALSLPGYAGTLANVTLPDTITVGSRTLVLNGMGIRSKFFVKVYVAGLYLEKKSVDPGAIVQADAAKRIVLQFVRSEVTKEQMREAFDEALKANAPEKAGALRAESEQFLAALETMREKEQLAITYQPGIGTTVTVRGRNKVTIPGQALGQLVFSMWLGPKPPNSDLKKGLLGAS